MNIRLLCGVLYLTVSSYFHHQFLTVKKIQGVLSLWFPAAFFFILDTGGQYA